MPKKEVLNDLGKPQSPTSSSAYKDVVHSEWPILAGVKDSVVKDKTGLTWAEWVVALDKSEGPSDDARRDREAHFFKL